jgi:hypothetical protein
MFYSKNIHTNTFVCNNTCDQSDDIHEPGAFDRAIAHGPMSQVVWCGGFSFCLHWVSLVEEQLTDLDLMPIPQVVEHYSKTNQMVN